MSTRKNNMLPKAALKTSAATCSAMRTIIYLMGQDTICAPQPEKSRHPQQSSSCCRRVTARNKPFVIRNLKGNSIIRFRKEKVSRPYKNTAIGMEKPGCCNRKEQCWSAQSVSVREERDEREIRRCHKARSLAEFCLMGGKWRLRPITTAARRRWAGAIFPTPKVWVSASFVIQNRVIGIRNR